MTDRAPDLPDFYRLLAFDSLPSTMDECRRHAAEGAPEGLLVWAREQTAGRGRRGRSFLSPRGNLYLSLLLRPDGSPADGAQLGFVAAVALAEAVAALLPDGETRVRLKWPNDLLIDRAKASGILLEGQPTAAGKLDWIILGIGVNMASHPADMPYPATSLGAAGSRAEPAELLGGFARRFTGWHELWRRRGFAPVREAWLAHAAGVGEAITVRLPQETLEGRFADLDDTGILWIELAGGGGRRSVATGDLYFPAG
jgi:BirA family biotin operon repressor/biotin-[acetyl-CoA-carboxylase] ligase